MLEVGASRVISINADKWIEQTRLFQRLVRKKKYIGYCHHCLVFVYDLVQTFYVATYDLPRKMFD